MGFSPIFVTHTGILTSNLSTAPLDTASAMLERSPTISLEIRNFGTMLSPGTSSAQSHSTSELLRTLLMVAASKPTS